MGSPFKTPEWVKFRKNQSLLVLAPAILSLMAFGLDFHLGCVLVFVTAIFSYYQVRRNRELMTFVSREESNLTISCQVIVEYRETNKELQKKVFSPGDQSPTLEADDSKTDTNIIEGTAVGKRKGGGGRGATR